MTGSGLKIPVLLYTQHVGEAILKKSNGSLSDVAMEYLRLVLMVGHHCMLPAMEAT